MCGRWYGCWWRWLIWSADNCWRVHWWLTIRWSRNYRRCHCIWVIWHRWLPSVHGIRVVLIWWHAAVVVVRWRWLGWVVWLVVIASTIVHGCWWLLVELCLWIELLATPAIVNTLPCRQMTAVHHAGVGEIPSRLCRGRVGWRLLSQARLLYAMRDQFGLVGGRYGEDALYRSRLYGKERLGVYVQTWCCRRCDGRDWVL